MLYGTERLFSPFLLFLQVFAWLLDQRVAPMRVLIISREKTAVHENWISKSKYSYDQKLPREKKNFLENLDSIKKLIMKHLFI